MVSENDIYKVIKQCLPEGLKPRFGYSKTSTKSSDGIVTETANTVSVFIKSAKKPKRTLNGDYYGYTRRIVFNLYTNRGNEIEVNKGYEYLDYIKSRMNLLHNVRVNIGTDTVPKYVRIVDSELVIDSNYVGLNEQGVHTFSLEYKLKF